MSRLPTLFFPQEVSRSSFENTEASRNSVTLRSEPLIQPKKQTLRDQLEEEFNARQINDKVLSRALFKRKFSSKELKELSQEDVKSPKAVF